VLYNNLIHRPDVVLRELHNFLGAPVALPEELVDANRKWLGKRPGELTPKR